MTRIESNAPGNIQPTPQSWVGKEEELSLDHLPEDLPPPSHIKLSSLDVTKLILPEGVDLSRVPKDHPLRELLNTLWLKVTLKAIVEGGEHSKSSASSILPPLESIG
jgi:hypothetical protein